jgi:hypothetical protein
MRQKERRGTREREIGGRKTKGKETGENETEAEKRRGTIEKR